MIGKAGQTITFAAPAAKSYGDSDFGPGATVDTGLPITYSSDNDSVATITSNGLVHIVGAGTAVITASQAGDAICLPATAQQTLTVNKGVITVTADNTSRAYGAADPAFTTTYSGFVYGENASVITGAPTFTTNADSSSPQGSYTITPVVSGLSAANYTFTTATGTLAVGLASQTITFNPLAAKGYGDGSFTLTATGGASGNPITYSSGDTTVATANGATVTIVGAGTTTIIASQAGTPGAYASATAQQSLTVTKALLAVTADNKQRTYNSANPTFTATYIGFVNGDDSSVVTGVPTFTTAAVQASPAGSYPIVPVVSGLSATNYTFVAANGTLAIDVASQTVTFAELAARIYGDTPFDLSATGAAPTTRSPSRAATRRWPRSTAPRSPSWARAAAPSLPARPGTATSPRPRPSRL